MYDLDSTSVASVLDNHLVFAAVSFIIFICIIGLSQVAGYVIAHALMAIRDFIKGYRNNIGDNMALDIEIEAERKHNNR